MLGPHIPGRELPEEVATRRFWSVCRPLGAVLLGTMEGAGLAEIPPSEALGLHTKIGAHYPEVGVAGPGNTGRSRVGPSKASAMDMPEPLVCSPHLRSPTSNASKSQV